MRTVIDIDAQCAVCVCVCVLVWVRLLHKSKSPKKYMCVHVNDPPTCCPCRPLFLSPTHSSFFSLSSSLPVPLASIQCELLCCGVFKNPFDIIWVGCPSSCSLSPSLPLEPLLGLLSSRGLSRAAFSTAQQIEFPAWTPPTSSACNLRTCQPKETHAQSSNALPFNVGVTLRRVASPLPAPCVAVWSCTWHFTAKTQ